MSGAAECAERSFCALFATVVKPISDLRLLISGLCALLFAVCLPAEAQQTGKLFRIGFLDNGTASGTAVLLEPFRQELSKLGWVEGKNIAIEYRFTEVLYDLAA